MLISCPLTSDCTHTHTLTQRHTPSLYCIFSFQHSKHYILALKTCSFSSVFQQLSQSLFQTRALSVCVPVWSCQSTPVVMSHTNTDSALSVLMTFLSPSFHPSLPPSEHHLGTTDLSLFNNNDAPVHCNQFAVDCYTCTSSLCLFSTEEICCCWQRRRNRDIQTANYIFYLSVTSRSQAKLCTQP